VARGGGVPTAWRVTQPTGVEVEAAARPPAWKWPGGDAKWVDGLRARDRASALAGRLYARWLRCGGERRSRCGGHTAEM
jgi:hypothetical protein